MATSRICAIPDCGKPKHSHGYCSPHSHRFNRYGDPLGGGPVKDGAPARFLNDRALVYLGEDCLLWPHSTDSHGYARISLNRVSHSVTRIVCEAQNGPAPTPDHQAAHECGRGHLGCVARRHLTWKTRTENNADRIRHGTTNRGERHGMSKLTTEDVIAIRSMHGRLLQREIAAQFGVSIMAVNSILKGRSWSWLTPPA